MKYLILFSTITAFLITSNSFAQNTSFGVTGGLLNGGEKFKSGDASASASDTGFYIGVNSRIPINDKLLFTPELDYGNLNNASFGFLSARIQYYPVSKFYLQAGPQISYIFEALGDSLKKGGLDLSSGIGYDINENFHIQARYSFELTNRSTFDDSEVSSRLRWLQIGFGYSF
jgi:hypothetical protein